MPHFTSRLCDLPEIPCDFSNLEETCCYCSAESADAIRKAISGMPVKAIHLIGTGDYHYITLFWLERIDEPFSLILFDNHPDDQPAAFGGILSCGSWVGEARALPFCKEEIWIRTAEDLRGAVAQSGADGLPVYLSIDLDVLSPAFAHTDWDQGKMALDELCEALTLLASSRRILGADICGGISDAQGGTPEDAALNAAAVSKINAALNR